MFVSEPARSYGIFKRGAGNILTMMPTPPFNPLLYKRARIVEDYGGGKFSIPNEYEVMVLEQPGRRVRPRQGYMHEDPSVIPVEDELLMDPYNVELMLYKDDIRHNLNYHHMTLANIMHHMNIPRMNDAPE